MDRTTEVMRLHLEYAEKYIKEMEKAQTKEDIMEAVNRCSLAVKNQYPDLEEIAEDYCRKITEKSDPELAEISTRVGEIYGKEVTAFYGKMGRFMADADFMETFSNFDIVIGNNPLFGTNEFGSDVAVEVSKTIAGSMDSLAAKMMADSTDVDEAVILELEKIMESFLDLSKRYVAKMSEVTTGRKAVTATDAFVSGIKRLVPEMKKYADMLKLLMAGDKKPEKIIKLAAELNKTLGDELKNVMQDKQDIIAEQKVQKAVGRLGSILNEVPF